MRPGVISSKVSPAARSSKSSAAQAPKLLLVVHTHCSSYVHLPAHLSEAGFQLDLVARAGNPLLRSRCVDQSWAVVGPPEKFVETVAEQVTSGAYDAMQVLDEPAVIALFGGETDPRLVPYRPFSHPVLVNGIGRKDRFHVWCDEAGLPAPRTRLLHSWSEVEPAARAAGFPVYVKGSTGSGGQTVCFIQNREQLDAARAELADAGPWLVQQAITGGCCGVQFAAHQGRLLGWFALHKRVTLRGGLGPTVIGEFCAPEGMEEICRRACESGGLNGLNGFDFLMGPDGRPLLIDPHIGRCTTMNHFGPWCGVNLAGVWRAALIGANAEVARPSSTGDVFGKFPECLQLILDEGITPGIRQYRPWWKRVRIWYGRPREWRAIGCLLWDLFVSSARIRGGRLRARLNRSVGGERREGRAG